MEKPGKTQKNKEKQGESGENIEKHWLKQVEILAWAPPPI